MKIWLNYLIISFILTLIGCTSSEVTTHKTKETEVLRDTVFITSEQNIEEKEKTKLGIDVLQENNFDILENKRVGLITNQTGVNSNLKSTIDILNEAENVELTALFSPEHGVRGDVEGGSSIRSYKDEKTGLPVFSLYGKNHKPSKKMLKNIDVLVYDIQDIGVRSYTFISTLGLTIEAASENGIEFVVLDRPNPLGGNKVEGNIREEKFTSFISQYPIPYVYGLTCGELAKFLIGEKILNVNKNFNLTIIPMQNWNRNMNWNATGLKWIPTSPHIPHQFSPYFYPMTGILGELRSAISIGVGYTLPFQLVGAEWIDNNKLAKYLNDLSLPGLHFRAITYRPYYAFGKLKVLKGVQLYITDFNNINLTNTQFYIIVALKKLFPDKNLFSLAKPNEVSMFNKGIGTNKIFEIINKEGKIDHVIKFLNKDIESFKKKSAKYYLYK
ncbi:MAG: hypothetical protein CR986_06320 [Ignavibacteriae bacterium]|nr:MAG: hypothetical protein CR986_06320 [Ignavibacteriota bacterium]